MKWFGVVIDGRGRFADPTGGLFFEGVVFPDVSEANQLPQNIGSFWSTFGSHGATFLSSAATQTQTAQKGGSEDATLHKLRHRCATRLLESGSDIVTVRISSATPTSTPPANT